MGNIDYQKIYNYNRKKWEDWINVPGKYEALLAGHYSDSNHFIYELLHNAEDKRASKVMIEYYESKLVFYHNGRPFDENDVVGVSSMLTETKNSNSSQVIGKFGMGFKSVFKYTDQPEIYSDGESFRIEKYLLPVEIQDGWDFREEKNNLRCEAGTDSFQLFVDDEHLTKIVIPFVKRRRYAGGFGISENDVLEKLQELPVEILLFFNSVKDLYWIDMKTGRYSWITARTDENDIDLVTCRADSTSMPEMVNISKYLRFKKIFNHPQMKAAEVSIAYKVDDNININPIYNSNICVYFPTKDRVNIPFLIHGTFESTVSREKIALMSDFNNILFDKIGDLICESLYELRDKNLITEYFLRTILLESLKEENSLRIPNLKKKVNAIFLKDSLLPDINGEYRKAWELSIAVPFEITDFCDKSLFEDSFADVKGFVAFGDRYGANFTEYLVWLRADLKLNVYGLKRWSYALSIMKFGAEPLGEEDILQLNDFYDFLSNYSEEYRFNSQNGLYENIIKEGLIDAWAQFRQAKLILNSENMLMEAYIKEEPNIYLDESGESAHLAGPSIVNPVIVKSDKFKRMLTDGFKLARFDNFQYVKGEIINIADKYSITRGSIKFNSKNGYEDEYIDDIRRIIDLMKAVNYDDRIVNLLRDSCIIKIELAGKIAFECPRNVYLNKTVKDAKKDIIDDGIDLITYFTGIDNLSIYHADTKFFVQKGIFINKLHKLGMIQSLVDIGPRFQEGFGDNYWEALGDYCPGISVRNLQENFKYISLHPRSQIAKKKSAEILKLLLKISGRLKGEVRRRKKDPYTVEEEAPLLQLIRESAWLYGKDGNIHKISSLSKYDLNDDIYDTFEDKLAYSILGFKKTKEDENEDTFYRVNNMDEANQRRLYHQLNRKFGGGIGSAEIQESAAVSAGGASAADPLKDKVFPVKKIQNIERLKEHVREQFFFADPVKYENVLSQIRTGKSRAEQSYAMEMYTNENGVCICQMCREPANKAEVTEIGDYGIELPQLNLCLCGNCAARYKIMRNYRKEGFRNQMRLLLRNINMSADLEEYSLIMGTNTGTTLTFTPTHLAEIQAIFNLIDEFGLPDEA